MVNNLLGLQAQEDPFKPKQSTAKATCEARGGTWDEATQTCKLPEKKEETLKDVTPEGTRTDLPKGGTPVPGTKGIGTQITDPRTGKTFIVNPTDLATIQGQQAGAGGVAQGSAPATFQTQADINAANQAAAIEEERARLTAEETPVRRELSPETGLGEGIPIIGGIMGVSRRILEKPIKKLFGLESSPELILQPEVMRTVALTEIERQETERGLTLNEQFGAFVESIPVAGSLAAKYAGGLIETPSENAKQVKQNILKERKRIANIETNVKLGYLPVEVAQEQVIDIEQNVQRLESRIRMLINNSPELRFNSDYVNTVETEILATREKAFQAKQNILTGASVNPDEVQLLSKLQDLAGTTEE